MRRFHGLDPIGGGQRRIDHLRKHENFRRFLVSVSRFGLRAFRPQGSVPPASRSGLLKAAILSRSPCLGGPSRQAEPLVGRFSKRLWAAGDSSHDGGLVCLSDPWSDPTCWDQKIHVKLLHRCWSCPILTVEGTSGRFISTRWNLNFWVSFWD